MAPGLLLLASLRVGIYLLPFPGNVWKDIGGAVV